MGFRDLLRARETSAYLATEIMPADRPDLVVFLTDQERAAPAYESPDLSRWREQSLRAHRWFRLNGTSFNRHYTGATACVPSRPTLLTGQYPDVHGATQTDGTGKVSGEPRMRWLRPGEVPTVGHWFNLLGYDTFYVGKWHASHEDLHDERGRTVATNTETGEVIVDGVRAYERANVLQPFGFSGWIGPEPHGAHPANSGLVRDRLYADQAVALLRDRERRRREGDPEALRPLLLFVSFVNPHDIVLWPRFAMRDPLAPDPEHPPTVPEAPTQYEDLRDKPATQVAYRDAYYAMYGPPGLIRRAYEQQAERYRRTYMRLHLEVDRQIERVRAEILEGCRADRTIMVLTSDHGELLGAHGGLHQKWMNLYEECVRVPFVIAHGGSVGPKGAVNDEQLTSHVDLLPTLIGLAGGDQNELASRLEATHTEVHPLPGRDLAGLVTGKDASDLERTVYLMTRDNIAEGDDGLSVGGRLFGSKLPFVPLGAEVPAYVGTNVEALVARVPAEQRPPDTGRLWKLVRTFDDPATWTEPEGRQLVRRLPNGARYRSRVLVDAWELYDLDRDPAEGRNRAHDPVFAEVLAHLKGRLQTEQRLLVPRRHEPWPYASAARGPDPLPLEAAAPARALQSSRRILASRSRVWDVLSDFGGLARWFTEAEHSSLLTERGQGVGAERRVQVGKLALVETVVAWEPERALAYDIEGLPAIISSSRTSWQLEDAADGGTRVSLLMHTRMAAGPVGALLYRAGVSRALRARAKGLLRGLERACDLRS